jgi:hypothetical protein
MGTRRLRFLPELEDATMFRCRAIGLVVWFGLMAPAWSAGQENVTKVPDKVMESWLKKDDRATVERQGKGKFKLTLGEDTVIVTNKQVDCWFYGGFDTGGKGDLEVINKWNNRSRGTRAYLDEDGDPCLEMDVDFEGGINEFAFYGYLSWFKLQLERFEEEVVK